MSFALFLMLGSIVLSIINAGVMIALSKHLRWGWLVTTFAHIFLWIPYSILSDQWGFLGLALVHAYIGYKGYREWSANEFRTKQAIRRREKSISF
jgi:hypothetical protein